MPSAASSGVPAIATSPDDMTAWPPNTDAMSITVTRAPRSAASIAAESPATPAPTTTTSGGGAAVATAPSSSASDATARRRRRAGRDTLAIYHL
jgi:hypothetical protein